MYYKSLDTHILKRASKDDERQVFSFVASTSSPDRYGDIVGQNWDLSKFRNNPVILLNHNANQLPIGRGEVDVIDGKLMVDVEFDMGDPMAAEVARKVREGFISAVSVGFNPIESTPRSMLPKDSPYYGKRGQYFESAELLEVSVVTIPANGEAVAAKNYTGQNRAFRISELKHIIDVEMDGDRVIVTYLMHEDREDKPEEPEEMEGHHDDEDKEGMSYHDDEDSDEEKRKDDEDEDKEDKKFLTNQERDFFALLTNGE